jgi:hypothetical protein
MVDMYFSHHVIFVYSSDVESIANDWSDRHVAQGFAALREV